MLSCGNMGSFNPLHWAGDWTNASTATQATSAGFLTHGAMAGTPLTFFFWRGGGLGPHPRHMEVPRIWAKLELQLPAYTTATTTLDPSHVCNLHHSSWQCQIFNPLSEARDWTYILMNASQIAFHWAMIGTPNIFDIVWFMENRQRLGVRNY